MPDNSELVNALSGGGLLSSIANPRVMNPNLVGDAYGKASDVANSLWRNKLYQSQQAAGDAFRASLNPDGTPNQPLLNQKLAADPNASLSALTASTGGQALDNATFTTQMQRVGAMANSNLELLTRFDGKPPLDEIKKNIENHAKQFGFTPDQVTQAESMFSDDPAANGHVMLQNTAAGLSHLDALHAARPGTGTVTGTGGQLQGYQTAPLFSNNPGAVSVPNQPGAQQGPGPDTVFTAPPAYVPDNRPGAMPGSFMPVPRSYPGASPGGGNPLLDGKPDPAPGSADGNPAMGGQTEGALGSKATPIGPADRARTAAVQQSALAPPQGQAAQLDAGNKVYNDAANAVPDQQKRLIAGESALQALDIAKTGPGTGTVAKAKAFFESQGITAPPQGILSDVDYRQVLVKNLLRFAQDKSKSTGTDLGLETQLHSNANADEMLPNANRHVLVQDLGILRRDMGQTATMPQGAAAIDHVKNFSANIDPRAFATKYMTADEIGTMVKGMGTKEREKFVKSLKVANDSGHVE